MNADRAHQTHSSVGDHLVLDFLNTVAVVDGILVDSLQSGKDVLDWLAGAGLPHSFEGAPGGDLLETTRTLREALRAVIERSKLGKSQDLQVLNGFLASSRSHWKLAFRQGSVQRTRVWDSATAEELLAPLAEAASELLTEGNLELVKQCEDASCVLWFYDRTKAHRRRWCSMATCGNRNKVAAFRSRQQG